MAYLRSENYIWRDESGLHIWSKDGYDNWDICAWAEDEEEKRWAGYENASGVSISMDVMDEYVVMRLAQLIHEGKLGETVQRVVTEGGNFGSMMLRQNAHKIIEALAHIEMNDVKPDWWKRDTDGNTACD